MMAIAHVNKMAILVSEATCKDLRREVVAMVM